MASSTVRLSGPAPQTSRRKDGRAAHHRASIPARGYPSGGWDTDVESRPGPSPAAVPAPARAPART